MTGMKFLAVVDLPGARGSVGARETAFAACLADRTSRADRVFRGLKQLGGPTGTPARRETAL
ncbi:hypothetical protein [Pseudofrankia sp. BMG5.37]|uniref:hypothetical protein n=1 Tax=Pseudofrankia sp. BMG5.37 TaxID=3050035 RepID=UPI0028958114|nr:hypothetical protein [Pseudofrankia sp. BMG5.37]MDT3443685.1 hypothetical protein [Pseudofrankia sp. BMG5.37]